jgi:hypothetical protein
MERDAAGDRNRCHGLWLGGTVFLGVNSCLTLLIAIIHD